MPRCKGVEEQSDMLFEKKGILMCVFLLMPHTRHIWATDSYSVSIVTTSGGDSPHTPPPPRANTQGRSRLHRSLCFQQPLGEALRGSVGASVSGQAWRMVLPVSYTPCKESVTR